MRTKSNLKANLTGLSSQVCLEYLRGVFFCVIEYGYRVTPIGHVFFIAKVGVVFSLLGGRAAALAGGELRPERECHEELCPHIVVAACLEHGTAFFARAAAPFHGPDAVRYLSALRL